MAGCATTGIERVAETTSKMQTVQTDIKQAVAQADATNTSLENLIKPEQKDLKSNFDAYSDNVGKMDKIGKQLNKHIDQMIARGRDYFTEWEREGETYKDVQLRELSAERRTELRKVFDQIPETSSDAKRSLDAYLTEINEIREQLSIDLTPKGVETITPIAEKTVRDGNDLKEAVKPMLSAMDRGMAEMGQGAAAGGQQ